MMWEMHIAFAVGLLPLADRPELKKLAEDIIKTQNDEIAKMEQWRKQWYGQ